MGALMSGLTPPANLFQEGFAFIAWTVSYLVIGLACGASGAMALYLKTSETMLALSGWGCAMLFSYVIVEPVWIAIVVCMGAVMRGCLRAWVKCCSRGKKGYDSDDD